MVEVSECDARLVISQALCRRMVLHGEAQYLPVIH